MLQYIFLILVYLLLYNFDGISMNYIGVLKTILFYYYFRDIIWWQLRFDRYHMLVASLSDVIKIYNEQVRSFCFFFCLKLTFQAHNIKYNCTKVIGDRSNYAIAFNTRFQYYTVFFRCGDLHIYSLPLRFFHEVKFYA